MEPFLKHQVHTFLHEKSFYIQYNYILLLFYQIGAKDIFSILHYKSIELCFHHYMHKKKNSQNGSEIENIKR